MGDYIGRRVNKEVKGVGTVKSYNSGTGSFEIVYDSGDSEVVEMSHLICLFNGSSELQQPIPNSTVGRKPKKRQRTGNNNAAVEMNYENCSGNLSNGLNLDLNYDAAAVNLTDDVDIDGEVDLNKSQGLNLDLNKGVDLNVEEYIEGSLNRSNVIDLNVDANGDVGHILEDVEIKNCFDLNLGLDEVSKNIDVGGEDETSKKMMTCCFGEGGTVEKEGSRDNTERIDGGDEEKVPVETCLITNESANGTLQEVEVQWTTPNKDNTGGLEVQNGVLQSLTKGKRGRKKRKPLDAGKGVTETVLRRSARRARIDSFPAEDHVSCAVVSDAASDPLLSPAVSVVSEEKIVLSGHEESEKCDVLPPKMDLPISSSSLDLDGIPVLDVFSVYSFLRSFSTLLFLSPFDLEDFVACIKANYPTLLFDSVHFSLLQILRKHLEFLSVESSESASGCLRSLNWDLLDLITWPVFMVEYLLLHGSELKPSFDLSHFKLFERDYYNHPAYLKIEMLRCLCDDVIEVEAIQSELNRRIVTAEITDFDRNLKSGSSKKRRASMNVAAGSCLGEEAVDESTDWNSDECCLCKMDGSLICCDGCPAAFHSKCVGVANSHLPEGDWYCPECLIVKKKPWLNLAKSIRGAELLATDPYGRLYYSCCDYLLVSDPREDEFSPKYYHRNDLALVIGMMKSSENVYGTVLSAIMKLPDTSMAAGAKCDLDTRLKTMSSNFPVLIMSQHEEKVNERKQVEKLSSCSDDVGYGESETVDPSMKMGNMLPGSEGSAEISQDVVDNQRYKEGGTFEDSNLTAKIMETRSPFKERKGNESVNLGPSTMNSKGIMLEEQSVESYANCYSFARMASSIVEELTKKSPGKSGEDATKTMEEIISVQLKAISSKSIEFSWTNIQNMKIDARKEKCGWCFSCKVPECEKDCLFVQNSTGPAPESFSSDALGVRSMKNRKSHLVNVLCYILSTEERLHGLLSGPWLNPHHSQSWRKDVLNAQEIATLRGSLLALESNLRSLALNPDWLKHVDSLAKMGSGHHIIINSPRVRHGIGKKKARHLEPELNPSSNAGSGLGMFWWRGGRLSRQLFNWKVLPQSLARKAARQGGCKKIPDMLYPDSSDFAKRSKCIAWRAAVETSRTVEQLALQVRDLDAHIRWNDIGNTNILAIIDKEFQKAVRSFKKVTVRRKSLEGSVVKYLLDFGKRRFLPDIVVRCGTIPEEDSNERKRYWLEESHMPLHLVKGFEEKRIARISSKITVGKHCETKRIMKKPLKGKGFAYLFLRAEKPEYYQCGHCNKDVLIREAVSCQYCKGFFHKRHVRKSTGVVAAEFMYTCHKCADENNVRKNVKRGRIELRKSKKMSKALRSLSSKVESRGTKNKQPAQSQSSKKEPVVIPLRRSSRRAKVVIVQNKKIGRKKGKQTKRGRGRPRKQAKVDISEKKKPAEVAWRRKRMQLCRIYWLNGLLLSQKPNDERVTLFRSNKLLVHSGELAAIADQPKCSLCGELEYTPTSNYIACEVCGDWFHGDAFGLTAERVTKLIGFKCHKCRQRTPPPCAHLHTMHSKGKQVMLESTVCKSADETCDIESTSSKGPLEQKSHLNDKSGSCFTGDSGERCPQGTLPDSCHAENGSLPIFSSEQRETVDSFNKMDIVLPDEPVLSNDYVNHNKEEHQRASNELLTSNDSSLLNDHAIEVNPREDME
ncbi:putative hexokinase-3-like [Capsicum annuum]|nr:putative hexokinase-3-like [Capsicum annuum]KAF3628876.1 putative hexokinase-3-like [Capsicum annuum]